MPSRRVTAARIRRWFPRFGFYFLSKQFLVSDRNMAQNEPISVLCFFFWGRRIIVLELWVVAPGKETSFCIILNELVLCAGES